MLELQRIIPPVGKLLMTPCGQHAFGTVCTRDLPVCKRPECLSCQLIAAAMACLGQAIQRLHSTSLPPAIVQRIPHETYPCRRTHTPGPDYRSTSTQRSLPDEVAERLLAFCRNNGVKSRYAESTWNTWRTRRAAANLLPVTCHGDLHAGNIFLGDDGQLHTVDWDTLIRAPKERDLMFIGGAQGFIGTTPQTKRGFSTAAMAQPRLI
ncbi:MAG: phosphotransferase [Kouleothrix sp.]